ncbi:MAG: hypothetical protein KY391_08650 [Actinobacteria bacterium]|nr:hypothetical protein [Actinomycetota bacterium]
MNVIGELAGSIGRGLFAGALGTVAMTLSSTIEMKLRDREGSSAPAKAAGKVLGVEPTGADAKERFSNLVHFGYGTGWGAARGVIGYAGLRGPIAAAAHLGVVWGTELVMLPALDVSPPVTEWGSKEVGIDWFHHAVYAAATSVAYEWLEG